MIVHIKVASFTAPSPFTAPSKLWSFVDGIKMFGSYTRQKTSQTADLKTARSESSHIQFELIPFINKHLKIFECTRKSRVNLKI